MKIVLLVYPIFEKCPETAECSAFAEISETVNQKQSYYLFEKKVNSP